MLKSSFSGISVVSRGDIGAGVASTKVSAERDPTGTSLILETNSRLYWRATEMSSPFKPFEGVRADKVQA